MVANVGENVAPGNSPGRVRQRPDADGDDDPSPAGGKKRSPTFSFKEKLVAVCSITTHSPTKIEFRPIVEARC